MVDQQEALERQRELYQEKNEHLERFLEPVAPVSYTHLDVYKRQRWRRMSFIGRYSRRVLSRGRDILRSPVCRITVYML